MSVRIFCLAILVATVSLSGAQGTNRSFLAQRYTEFTALTRKRDKAGLEKWMKAWTTPDFAYFTSDKQTLTREQVLSSLEQQLALMKSVDSAGFKIQRLSEKEDSISATVATTLKATVVVNAAKNVTGKLVSESISIDQWIKTPAGWRLKRITTTRDRTTIDGKELGS